jgi:hypothetical protein
VLVLKFGDTEFDIEDLQDGVNVKYHLMLILMRCFFNDRSDGPAEDNYTTILTKRNYLAAVGRL